MASGLLGAIVLPLCVSVLLTVPAWTTAVRPVLDQLEAGDADWLGCRRGRVGGTQVVVSDPETSRIDRLAVLNRFASTSSCSARRGSSAGS